MNQKDKILGRLAKLRASMDSAKAVDNMEEAQNYAAMYTKLLLEHKIAEAEVDAFGTLEGDGLDESVFVPFGAAVSRKNDWVVDLTHMLANHMFCKILVYRGSNRITIFGKAHDREMVGYLTAYLSGQMQRIGKRQRKKHRNRGGSITGFLDGFRFQTIEEIDRRLRAMSQEVIAAANAQSALMRTHEQLDAEFRQKWPHLGFSSTRGYDLSNHAGLTAGLEFGRDVELTRTGLGGGNESTKLPG